MLSWNVQAHRLAASVFALFFVCMLSGCADRRTAGGDSRQAISVKAMATPQQAVQNVFVQYKAFDLANDPKIMSLYADNAKVDVLGTVYDKAGYTKYVSDAYAAGGAANSHMKYSDLEIADATSSYANAAFTGTLGPNTMSVHWFLQPDSSGNWKIVEETFAMPR